MPHVADAQAPDADLNAPCVQEELCSNTRRLKTITKDRQQCGIIASYAPTDVAIVCTYTSTGEPPVLTGVLRTKGQVHQWQETLSFSIKRTFGHFEQPLPMSLHLLNVLSKAAHKLRFIHILVFTELSFWRWRSSSLPPRPPGPAYKKAPPAQPRSTLLARLPCRR